MLKSKLIAPIGFELTVKNSEFEKAFIDSKISDFISETTYDFMIGAYYRDSSFQSLFATTLKKELKGSYVGDIHYEADCGNLEIQTPLFSSEKDALTSCQKILEGCKIVNLEPSIIVDWEKEGGCHVNFDLQSYSNSKKGKSIETIHKEFNIFLLQNPSIVWSLLSPNDNITSRLILNKDSNADYNCAVMLKSRPYSLTTSLTRLELRFFSMFKTIPELKFYIKIATSLLRYILKQKKIPLKQVNLKEYSFKKANKNLKKICKELKLDYNEFIAFGKVANLKKRINEYGKEYLN